MVGVFVGILYLGYLGIKAIADALKKYNCSVSISIDGPQQYHDKFRVDKKDQGSFQKSLRAIEYLRDANIKPAISCTLPSPNIENIDIISSFFRDELGIQAIGFNQRMVGYGCVSIRSWTWNCS